MVISLSRLLKASDGFFRVRLLPGVSRPDNLAFRYFLEFYQCREFSKIISCALRVVNRNRVYSVIKSVGPVNGPLLVFTLIVLFVRYEFGYDRYQANYDRIYRIVRGGEVEKLPRDQEVCYIRGADRRWNRGGLVERSRPRNEDQLAK